MNSIYGSTQFCGATGSFPIYNYIDETSNILSNYTLNTSNNLNQYIYNISNNLNQYIYNVSNEISPILFDLRDFQLSNPSAIMYRNSGHNNDTVIVESDSNAEILFKDYTLDCYSKIDVNGKLCVYHPLQALPAGYSEGWWDVEGRLSECLTLSEGVRFDLTNVQMDDLLQWSAISAVETTANTALSTAIGAVASIGVTDGVVAGIIAVIPSLINSNVLTDVNSFYISSNLLNKQNYINSNSIEDDLSFYISSNLLNKQNYINSNSIEDNLSFFISSNLLNIQNYINSNSIEDDLSFYISSNLLNKQNYINSNSIEDNLSFFISSNLLNIQNYINSNSISDNLSFYISSNILSKQKYINSNSITDNLGFYISSNLLNKQNYINSNSITDNLSFYISSNILNKQNYINSNSIADDLSFYMSSNLLNKQNYINSNSVQDLLEFFTPTTTLTTILKGYERINYIFISYASYRTDPTTSPPTFFYDLDITKYVKASLFENTYTTRIFRITTYMDVSWSNTSEFNSYIGGYCYPESITIYMSNSPLNGLGSPIANWCNGLIIGKLNSGNMGYWSIIPNNNSYIRFFSKLGYNTYLIIESLLI